MTPFFMAKILPGLRKFLTFGITLPVWAFIGVYLYFQYAESQAIKQVLVQLVAGAELEASKAREDAWKTIIVEMQRREDMREQADEQFRKRLVEADIKQGDLEDEIRELMARTRNPACVVDDTVSGLLRNN